MFTLSAKAIFSVCNIDRKAIIGEVRRGADSAYQKPDCGLYPEPFTGESGRAANGRGFGCTGRGL